MLRKFQQAEGDWPDHLNKVMWAIRTHVPRSTQYSPYHLVYGVQPRMAIDNRIAAGNDTTVFANDESHITVYYITAARRVFWSGKRRAIDIAETTSGACDIGGERLQQDDA